MISNARSLKYTISKSQLAIIAPGGTSNSEGNVSTASDSTIADVDECSGKVDVICDALWIDDETTKAAKVVCRMTEDGHLQLDQLSLAMKRLWRYLGCTQGASS